MRKYNKFIGDIDIFLMKDFKYILKNEIVIFILKKKIKTLKFITNFKDIILYYKKKIFF